MRSRSWIFAIVGLAALVAPAVAQDPEDLRRGVARISFLNGEVSIQRGDSQAPPQAVSVPGAATGEWMAAAVNAPVLGNDRISTAPNSRAELQFENGAILRIGGGADLTVTQLEADRYQLALGRGTVTFRILRASNTDMELDTPSVSVRPTKLGSYRVSVTESGDSEITARSGDVEIFTPRGSQWVSSGQTMLARGTASDPEYQIVPAAGIDDWDRWNDSRDRLITASPSQRYVPPGVYGAEDLDPYGNWVNVPQYGYVWQPVVAPGWAPYRVGRWVWLDWYGWTWVSADPWGWAPYHYGRWLYEPAFGWCWYPGALGVRHYWSPALVAFFGFGGGGLAVGFGNVGWVPLAPYEVLHPWWGRGFYGGPGYINRSVNIVNVNVTNNYRNSRVTNGFTAVSGADFRSGRFNNFVRPSTAELTQASSARGPLPVTPNSANLRFSDRQTAFVPRSTAPARVFSYRQPAPVTRTPFGDQRGFQQGGSTTLPNRPFDAPSAGRTQGGWTRFGAPVGQSTVPGGSGSIGRSEGGVQRFREPRAMPAPSPESSAQRGWSRFGEPSAGPRQSYTPPPAAQSPRNSGANQLNQGSGPAPLRVAPPVVRERQNNPGNFGGPAAGGFTGPRGGYTGPPAGGFNAPRGGGGSFNAPPRIAPPVVRERQNNPGNFGSRGGGFSAPRAPSGGDRGSRSSGGNQGGRRR